MVEGLKQLHELYKTLSGSQVRIVQTNESLRIIFNEMISLNFWKVDGKWILDGFGAGDFKEYGSRRKTK